MAVLLSVEYTYCFRSVQMVDPSVILLFPFMVSTEDPTVFGGFLFSINIIFLISLLSFYYVASILLAYGPGKDLMGQPFIHICSDISRTVTNN